MSPAPRIEFVKFTTADPNLTQQTLSARRLSIVSRNLDVSQRFAMIEEDKLVAEADSPVVISYVLEARLLLEDEYRP